VPRTRVLLVGLPGLLSGLIRGLVDRSTGLEIVGETNPEAILETVETMEPDVVVFGVQERAVPADKPLPLETLSARRPGLRVVAVDRDGRTATAYEPNAPPRTAAEVSANTLLSMIRGPGAE
jgi:chemotaxis response regulator CheB